MKDFTKKNREIAKKSYPNDVWLDEIDDSPVYGGESITPSLYCVFCIKENQYIFAEYIYRGNSVCPHHLEEKRKEADED